MPNKFPRKSESSHIIKLAPKLEWSIYQKALFKDIAQGEGHTIVEAYAGASKTTSIVESFKYIPKGKKAITLAFNKIIQEELRSRSPSYVDVFTFHSLGYRAIKQKFGNVEIDDNKVYNIVKELLDKAEHDLIVNICDTVAYCKYGLQDTPSQIENIIDQFGIDVGDLDRKSFIQYVIKALAKDKAITNKIDFNDMCWFPFIYNLFLGQYHYVFGDESQDLNKSQLVMAKKVCAAGGRMILVGDPNQAIYGWRFADSSLVQELKNQPKSKTLTLPISYRCPKKIINLAKYWVPDIICPESAKEGNIENISINNLYTMAKPGCFILSRTNAPMIKICMQFIKLGMKANIRGRDVGRQLGFLIKKSNKKQIPAFLKWLEKWKQEEIDRLQQKNFSIENVLDRYECLVNLCEECTSTNEVEQKAIELFNDTDENNIIILSTIHRAKGLERDNIFVLKWTLKQWLDENLKLLDKPNEEANLAYVACTRTKSNLYLVSKF
jgi:DNA helicase-2/ATP-dependent DNA helicase PcrA